MKIENYGVGKRSSEILRLFLLAEERAELPEGAERLILLPIPTSRDKKTLTGTKLTLDEAFVDIGQGDLACGYAIPEKYSELAKARGAVIFDASEDEAFLEENARLTALGALGYILTETDREPADISFGIVGYGRIGRIIARYLLFLGAKLKIYTTKELTRLELGRSEVSTESTKDGKISLDGVEILINTAPTRLDIGISEGRLPEGLRIIELASGDNFSGVEGVEALPSIPDRFYAKSAASAYFRAAKKHISEVFSK